MEDELRSLLDSRAEMLSDALAKRGVAERKDMLNRMLRSVLLDSSFCYVDGTLSRYDGRGYVTVAFSDLKDATVNVLSDMGVGASDLGKLGDTSFSVLKRKERMSSHDMVGFSNGVFCFTDSRFYRFDPAFVPYLTLPYGFGDMGCPLWLSFLEQVLPDASVRAVLQEFFGMCFIDRTRLSIEKMALLVGSGANGKSVVCDVMRSVLGGSSVVGNLSPDQLQEQKQIASLEGKVLNIAPDVRRGASFDSALKALASSQEITGWRLYSGGVVVKCPPLLFALNEMPYFRDTTKAFFRRLLVFRFDVTIDESRQDRTLASRIIANESCGVFMWAVEGMRRLLAGKGMFSRSGSMDESLAALSEDVKCSQNDILLHLENMGYATGDNGGEICRVYLADIVAGAGEDINAVKAARQMKSAGVARKRDARGVYYNLYRIC